MYQFPSFYELGNTCSDSYNNFLHEIITSSSSEMFNNINNLESSSVSPRSMAEAKAIAANKSHSEAERRRRKRINGHLATLRNLLPNTIKTDKASLLAEAVRCVRELKQTTSELGATTTTTTMSENDDDDDHTTLMRKIMFPSESDELNLSYCNESNNNNTDNNNDDRNLIIKASMCCEDRPEIMMELRRALSTVEGKIVRAEMSTVGGRIKCILWLEMLENGCKEGLFVQLRRALKVVMDKANFGPQNMGQDLLGNNKRPRLLGGPINYAS
ncbi:transcription factor bHLH30-like [Solanum pennellii]|uniref:Transcription factor bHLH30-like n=1 Tax=Solanum pennellii TaxID=28526 RepID=A0ABM1GKG6_SOLPN|nr:transcription factor bHLH30-like [Solanum pennellii]